MYSKIPHLGVRTGNPINQIIQGRQDSLLRCQIPSAKSQGRGYAFFLLPLLSLLLPSIFAFALLLLPFPFLLLIPSIFFCYYPRSLALLRPKDSPSVLLLHRRWSFVRSGHCIVRKESSPLPLDEKALTSPRQRNRKCYKPLLFF